MVRRSHPVVFIHGLWLHASSWQEWLGLFRAAGYEPVAPTWPGEHSTVAETRANPDDQANVDIDAATEHFARIIQDFSEPPIIIGHSVGGMIAEKLIGQGMGSAGVAIDPAQIKGVLPMPLRQLRATLPVMINPANASRAVSLTPDQFRFAFGNRLSRAESDELFEKWSIPSPARPLFQTALVNFQLHSQAEVNTANNDRPPLLLIAGRDDNTEPEVIVDSTLKQYRDSAAITEVRKFAGRGHSLTVDSGWRQVATETLVWLHGKGLGPRVVRRTSGTSR
ncbi:MAG: Alpha-beta hydrolase superfamily lysophospholipase [Glaciihabitans sp.]|nr:Alpha-beta hydrolase superfamily lysophospholipase [Glaciihabitans sp.]